MKEHEGSRCVFPGLARVFDTRESDPAPESRISVHIPNERKNAENKWNNVAKEQGSELALASE